MTRNWAEWIKAALIRAVRTFAQTAISMITIGQAFAEIDWAAVASVSGVAAVLSILTSLAGLPEVDDIVIEQNTFNEDPEFSEEDADDEE